MSYDITSTGLTPGSMSPPFHAQAIDVSVSDAALANCRELYVGTGGDVTVDTLGGETNVKYPSVPSGTFLSGYFTKVYHTGTTASGIVVRW